jgi:glutamine amidotransferase/cyclase
LQVSLGTDAVYAAEKLALQGEAPDGSSAIEQISTVYGRQAVVISVDPRRVYVDPPPPSSSSASSEAASFVDDKGHTVVTAPAPCPTTGRTHCWYQATVKGGREGRDIDAVQLAKACERLGAGEIMLNCIDADGQGSGYEHPLIAAVLAAVSVPVIASSGAGAASHFPDVFAATDVQAALAAGMFHRHEVAIADVKKAMQQRGFATRIV